MFDKEMVRSRPESKLAFFMAALLLFMLAFVGGSAFAVSDSGVKNAIKVIASGTDSGMQNFIKQENGFNPSDETIDDKYVVSGDTTTWEVNTALEAGAARTVVVDVSATQGTLINLTDKNSLCGSSYFVKVEKEFRDNGFKCSYEIRKGVPASFNYKVKSVHNNSTDALQETAVIVESDNKKVSSAITSLGVYSFDFEALHDKCNTWSAYCEGYSTNETKGELRFSQTPLLYENFSSQGSIWDLSKVDYVVDFDVSEFPTGTKFTLVNGVEVIPTNGIVSVSKELTLKFIAPTQWGGDLGDGESKDIKYSMNFKKFDSAGWGLNGVGYEPGQNEDSGFSTAGWNGSTSTDGIMMSNNNFGSLHVYKDFVHKGDILKQQFKRTHINGTDLFSSENKSYDESNSVVIPDSSAGDYSYFMKGFEFKNITTIETTDGNITSSNDSGSLSLIQSIDTDNVSFSNVFDPIVKTSTPVDVSNKVKYYQTNDAGDFADDQFYYHFSQDETFGSCSNIDDSENCVSSWVEIPTGGKINSDSVAVRAVISDVNISGSLGVVSFETVNKIVTNTSEIKTQPVYSYGGWKYSVTTIPEQEINEPGVFWTPYRSNGAIEEYWVDSEYPDFANGGTKLFKETKDVPGNITQNKNVTIVNFDTEYEGETFDRTPQLVNVGDISVVPASEIINEFPEAPEGFGYFDMAHNSISGESDVLFLNKSTFEDLVYGVDYTLEYLTSDYEWVEREFVEDGDISVKIDVRDDFKGQWFVKNYSPEYNYSVDSHITTATIEDTGITVSDEYDSGLYGGFIIITSEVEPSVELNYGSIGRFSQDGGFAYSVNSSISNILKADAVKSGILSFSIDACISDIEFSESYRDIDYTVVQEGSNCGEVDAQPMIINFSLEDIKVQYRNEASHDWTTNTGWFSKDVYVSYILSSLKISEKAYNSVSIDSTLKLNKVDGVDIDVEMASNTATYVLGDSGSLGVGIFSDKNKVAIDSKIGFNGVISSYAQGSPTTPSNTVVVLPGKSDDTAMASGLPNYDGETHSNFSGSYKLDSVSVDFDKSNKTEIYYTKTANPSLNHSDSNWILIDANTDKKDYVNATALRFKQLGNNMKGLTYFNYSITPIGNIGGDVYVSYISGIKNSDGSMLTGQAYPAVTMVKERDVPGFEIDKISNPVSGSNVSSGDVIEYTLRATNTGSSDLKNIALSDDFSNLQDFVNFDEVFEVTLNGEVVSVPAISSGDYRVFIYDKLVAGDVLEVKYEVSVREDIGSVAIENILLGEATPFIKEDITDENSEIIVGDVIIPTEVKTQHFVSDSIIPPFIKLPFSGDNGFNAFIYIGLILILGAIIFALIQRRSN